MMHVGTGSSVLTRHRDSRMVPRVGETVGRQIIWETLGQDLGTGQRRAGGLRPGRGLCSGRT